MSRRTMRRIYLFALGLALSTLSMNQREHSALGKRSRSARCGICPAGDQADFVVRFSAWIVIMALVVV